MHHKVANSQLLAALDLNDHGRDRPFPQCLVRAGKVDQVRRMRHGIADPGKLDRLTKGGGLLGCQRLGVPLVAVFGEDLNGLKAHLVRAATALSQPPAIDMWAPNLQSGFLAVERAFRDLAILPILSGFEIASKTSTKTVTCVL